jgi:hypothetical protein
VDTLTLDCGGTVNGTWGSTTAGATNINDTYFAPTTGLFDVANSSAVNPVPVIALIQPTCTTLTGTITVTVQNITDTYSFDNGLTYQTSNVIAGLPADIYNVIIKHRSGCLSPTTVATLSSSTKTWNGSVSSNWNVAANWTPSGVPVAANCIVVPDVSNDLVINGANYTASLYSLTVANGVTVTVEQGNSLKITDFINVNTGGTLVVQNNANLVQINDAINTGNIIYQRTPPTQVKETDYIYWSSPVAGLTLAGVSPSDYTGGTFYSFNSTTDSWTNVPINTVMSPGLGYIMRGQKTHNDPFTVNATFTGVPNNGPFNVSTGAIGNSILLGNPYPSSIDADKFLADNSTKIEGTLYFWTHSTKINGNDYTANDYASYNGTGSVATGNYYPEWIDDNGNRKVDAGEYVDKNGILNLQSGEWNDSNGDTILVTGEWTDTNGNNIAETGDWTDNSPANGIIDAGELNDINGTPGIQTGEWINPTPTVGDVFDTGEWTDGNNDKRLDLEVEQVSNKPNGKIAAGQGFFCTSAVSGDTVAFTNSMRVDVSGNVFNNSNFYKTNSPKARKDVDFEKNRVWLNLTNSKGAFKQLLLGYVSGATNAFDSQFDGESFDGNQYVDFYSINQSSKLTIQGRALPFDTADEVPLGYRSTIAGEFSISIDQVDGLMKNQVVFLEDKLTNTVFNLKTGNYTFISTAGTFNDRFVLRFKDKTLGTNDLSAQSNKVLVSVKNNQIKVNSLSEIIKKVTVYDLLGRQIYQKEKVGANELVLSNFTASNQILLVKTTLENGATVTKEVIY